MVLRDETKIKTGVLDPRPKILDFHMSGLTTHSYIPNKETWRIAEKGDLLCGLGYAVGRGRVNT
jgi:hypothetical protein